LSKRVTTALVLILLITSTAAATPRERSRETPGDPIFHRVMSIIRLLIQPLADELSPPHP